MCNVTLLEELENAEVVQTAEKGTKVRKVDVDQTWISTLNDMEDALDEVQEHIEEETEEQEEGNNFFETVEITAMSQEVTPEETPLPESPYKVKPRDCFICKKWCSSMIDLMNHVVEVHDVETGATKHELFMIAELQGDIRDQLRASQFQLEFIREENRKFKQHMTQTLVPDMMEGIRKIVRKELKEIDEAKEKAKKDEDEDVEVIKVDKTKPVKEDQVLNCPGCEYTSTNKQHMRGHMTKHKKKSSYNCTKCVRRFALEHSLKQHMESQHREAANPPVGHSQWAQQRNEEQVNCTKCTMVLKGTNELNQHMKKDHSHKCNECGLVHDNRDALITHLREVHSIDIYIDWSCKDCHEIFNGKENLDKHKCSEQDRFQERKQEECRYFRQGRCDWGDRGRFPHNQQQQQRPGVAQERPGVARERPGVAQERVWSEACRRGDGCTFLAAGRCHFFHRGVGVQQPRQGGQGGRQGSPGAVRPCRFQDRCRDWPSDTCAYSHEDFAMSRVIQENY